MITRSASNPNSVSNGYLPPPAGIAMSSSSSSSSSFSLSLASSWKNGSSSSSSSSSSSRSQSPRSRISIFAIIFLIFMLLIASAFIPFFITEYVHHTPRPSNSNLKTDIQSINDAILNKIEIDSSLSNVASASSSPSSPSSPSSSSAVVAGIVDHDSPTPPPSARRPSNADTTRQSAIRDAFNHAYGGYKSNCFGSDEYHPVTKRCSDWLRSGVTIIDSLSTMWVMGLKDEFQKARDWVEQNFDPSRTHTQVSVFETIIRVLGGLLSAYDFSKDIMFLNKAQLLADRLLPAFQTNTGIPHSQINPANGDTTDFGWTGGNSLLAEMGTVQVEFTYLAYHSKQKKYFEVAQRIIDHLDRLSKQYEGLYPIYIDHSNGQFQPSKITWGAMGDSFYEYLLKMWLLTGKKSSQYRRMYLSSVDGMMRHLVSSSSSGMRWISDLEGGIKQEKMDHLVCFVPGLLALGVYSNVTEDESIANKHLQLAKDLMETCMKMYTSFPLGLTPEYVRFFDDTIQPGDPSFKLRPETVESLFIMYRLTKQEKYREYGWTIFRAIETYAKTDTAYSGLSDCRVQGLLDDRMESFFLAETLKYLYLLFSDDSLIPITGRTSEYYVFNTECHPLTSFQSPSSSSLIE